ncbi:MAG: NADH-quinone oxidoreductase subunit N, partial [Deltaproteobacteria bacterium]|nr:NADH-quinone oxidoreductase subunit N [Deltaproteobacteria bacterium]
MMNVNWIQFAQQIAPWALPLAGGLFLLLVGPFLPKKHSLHFGFALAVVLASLYWAWQQWLNAQGDAIALMLFDKFTYLFVMFFLLALLLTLLLSYNYLESFGLVRPEYYALLLISVFGMGCMAGGHDLMVVFLGLEIMSVAVYVLAGFQRSNDLCVEAALKYFIVGAFASAFLLLGIAFIYGAMGTTNLIVLNKMGMSGLGVASKTFYFIGISLLGVGLGFKIAAVPFHYWAADVYEGAPVIVTTFMATAVKAAGFAALLRVVWAIFQWEPVVLSTVVWVAAALTMTIGNLAALVQRNLKRMLAYSSIAHAGYALVPLVVYAGRAEGVVSSIGFY